jgi:hypothetical protein
VAHLSPPTRPEHFEDQRLPPMDLLDDFVAVPAVRDRGAGTPAQERPRLGGGGSARRSDGQVPSLDLDHASAAPVCGVPSAARTIVSFDPHAAGTVSRDRSHIAARSQHAQDGREPEHCEYSCHEAHHVPSRVRRTSSRAGSRLRYTSRGRRTTHRNTAAQGTTKLVITTPSEIYIAGQLRKFGYRISPAANRTPDSADSLGQMLVRTGG